MGQPPRTGLVIHDSPGSKIHVSGDYGIRYLSSACSDASLDGVRKHLLPLRERIVLILPGVHAWATPGQMALSGCWCLIGDIACHDPLSYVFAEAASIFDTDSVLQYLPFL